MTNLLSIRDLGREGIEELMGLTDNMVEVSNRGGRSSHSSFNLGGSRDPQGAAELGDRFLYLRFEDLCADPEGELRRLLDFAGLAPGADLAEIAAKVQTPASAGRWRDHADRPFTEAQVEAVRRFGFEV